MKKILITTISVILLLNSCLHCGKQANQTTAKVYPGENVPVTNYTIDPNRDTTLEGKSGTLLHIYKNSFVDSEGLPFNGKVNLELREAITKEDILLGNMFTISNGNLLESGGMISVEAKSETRTLELASDKVIDVQLPTKQVKDSMQIYTSEFDSSKNQFNWLKPADIIVKVEKQTYTHDTLIDVHSKIKHDLPITALDEIKNLKEPVKPKKYSASGDTIMSLVFDTADFPELAEYRNVKFKLMDTRNFQASDTRNIWMSIDLKKLNEEGLYQISFSVYIKERLVEKSYKVSPVFSDKEDYAKAMGTYNKKYEQFENKKKEIEQKRLEAERLQKLEDEKRQKEYQEMLIVQAENNKKWEEQNKNYFAMNSAMNYVFSMKKLGWVNCDRGFNYENSKRADLITFINNPEELDIVSVSIILEDEKVCLSASKTGKNKFDFKFGSGKSILPSGEKAVLFVSAFKDNIPYFAIKKIRTEQNQEITVALEKSTLEDIKKSLKSNL